MASKAVFGHHCRLSWGREDQGSWVHVGDFQGQGLKITYTLFALIFAERTYYMATPNLQGVEKCSLAMSGRKENDFDWPLASVVCLSLPLWAFMFSSLAIFRTHCLCPQRNNPKSYPVTNSKIMHYAQSSPSGPDTWTPLTPKATGSMDRMLNTWPTFRKDGREKALWSDSHLLSGWNFLIFVFPYPPVFPQFLSSMATSWTIGNAK